MMPYLLCDFHIHTDWSDGKLTLREAVNLYGINGFDAIAITDHICDYEFVKSGQAYSRLTDSTFLEYLKAIKIEATRAWKKYKMVVIPGTEYTNQTNDYHIIGLDVKKYISPDGPVISIINEIHRQNGLAIACHPGIRESERGMIMDFSRHLRENREEYKNFFDAWEIGNRYDLFSWVGLEKLPYIAGSDFHRKEHLYSWKTLLKCEKNTEAIKKAIKKNTEIGIIFFKKLLT